MTRQQIKDTLNECGIQTYPGCRISVVEQANQLGVSVDEILGKLSDDTVLRAVAESLRVTGVHSQLNQE